MGSYHLFAQAHHFEKFWRSSFPVIIAFVAAITFSWHNIALGIWILVFGGVLMGQVGFTGQDRFGKWLLRGRQMLLHPLLQKLGHLSYPLYLIHWPLIILLLAGLLRWRPQITSLQALCLMLSFGLPIIVGAAWLLHKAVELPMMRWGKNLTGRK